ncbi:MAG: hypothetical protein R3A45_05250 [Bdellovibrionota bacterium]
MSLRFRGREVVHASVGKAQMDKIVDHLGSTAVIEQHPKLGRQTNDHGFGQQLSRRK